MIKTINEVVSKSKNNVKDVIKHLNQVNSV